ncbi:MAG: hemolysin III family protein [Clostridia bacterium]|nr:hemolysin III family protein [Clostridia bacterium]
MFDFKSVPLPPYSRIEDIVNSVTHAAGIPFVIVAAVMLLAKDGAQITGKYIAQVMIYAVSMFIVFFGSAFYHGLKPGYVKQVSRVVDHSNIFFMISGTLTGFYSFAVAPLNKPLAVGMITAAWCVTAVGVFLTFMNQEKFKWVQLISYVALGWSAVVGMVPIYKTGEAGKVFVWTVFAGGIMFTLGAVLYVIGKKKKYFHAVFHVFILFGAITMFIGMYRYI